MSLAKEIINMSFEVIKYFLLTLLIFLPIVIFFKFLEMICN